MKKFKVLASYRTYVYAIVEAEDEDQAYEIAREMDGAEFQRGKGDDLSDWSIDGINLELSEDRHHPICPAHDAIGCRCEELAKADLKFKVKELLYEYHAAEIGRLIGMTESEGKKIVRDIMLEDWGYTEWYPRNVGDGYGLFCHGSEWIDENGDNLLFDTEQEAMEYLERLPA
jgi:hypothetical protein